MAQEKRQQAVHDILRTLHKNTDKGLRELFAELNYEFVGQSLSSRKWPEAAKLHLADDPILFAAGGEDDAFIRALTTKPSCVARSGPSLISFYVITRTPFLCFPLRTGRHGIS